MGRMLGKGLQLKKLLDCLSVVSKVFEKLVSNSIVDDLEKCGLFLFPVWMTVVSNKIARAFNRSWATRAVTLDISKTIDRV